MIENDLTSSADIRRLDDTMSAFFKDGDWSGAEALLNALLARHPSDLARLARSVNDEPVDFLRWDDVVSLFHRYDKPELPITAMSIDLTGHWEGDTPGFEVCLYTDNYFPFSQSSVEQISAAINQNSAPWTGGFVDLTWLEATGPASLYREIIGYAHRFDGEPGVHPDYVAYRLALWSLYLRLHHALEAFVCERGMPRSMPVIVGQHDFSPYITTVLTCPRSAPDAQESNVAAETERMAEARRQMDSDVQGEIESYRLSRDTVRASRGPKSQQLINHIEFCKSRESRHRRDYQLGSGPLSWEMDDVEFEHYLARFEWGRKMTVGRNIFPEAESKFHSLGTAPAKPTRRDGFFSGLFGRRRT